jgi:hypothetical protein
MVLIDKRHHHHNRREKRSVLCPMLHKPRLRGSLAADHSLARREIAVGKVVMICAEWNSAGAAGGTTVTDIAEPTAAPTGPDSQYRAFFTSAMISSSCLAS